MKCFSSSIPIQYWHRRSFILPHQFCYTTTLDFQRVWMANELMIATVHPHRIKLWRTVRFTGSEYYSGWKSQFYLRYVPRCRYKRALMQTICCQRRHADILVLNRRQAIGFFVVGRSSHSNEDVLQRGKQCSFEACFVFPSSKNDKSTN